MMDTQGVSGFKLYELCQQKVVDIFAKMPRIIGVYQFGTINAPGNSDIDLMFVVAKERGIGRKIYEKLDSQFTEHEKRIVFSHPHIIVDEQTAPFVNYVRPCKDLRVLSGKQIDFLPVSNRFMKLYILVDLLIQYYPDVFFAVTENRHLLQLINAFKYPCLLYDDLVTQLGVSALPGFDREDYFHRNDLIRRSQEGPSVSYLSEMVSIAITIADEMKKRMAAFVRHDLGISCPRKGVFSHRGRLFGTSSALRELKIGKAKLVWCENPLEFAPIFYEPKSLPSSFRSQVLKRNSAIQEYYEFGLEFGGGRFPYLPWWVQYRGVDRVKQLAKDGLWRLAHQREDWICSILHT